MDPHPLVDHLVGADDLALDADVGEQVGVDLGVVLASAEALDHEGIVGAVLHLVAVILHQRLVEHDRLGEFVHAVVYQREVLVRLGVEFTELGVRLVLVHVIGREQLVKVVIGTVPGERACSEAAFDKE